VKCPIHKQQIAPQKIIYYIFKNNSSLESSLSSEMKQFSLPSSVSRLPFGLEIRNEMYIGCDSQLSWSDLNANKKL